MADYERIGRGTSATIMVTFRTDAGTTIDADAGVNVLIKRADGSTLSNGAAAHDGAAGSGAYKVTIAAQTNLNLLSLTWTGTFSGQAVTLVTEAEIVGGFMFTLNELRNSDTIISGNTAKYTTEKLLDARIEVESEFEDVCGRSFTPRFYRELDPEGDIDNGQLVLRKPEVHNITKFVVDGVDRIAWVTSNLITADPDDPFVLQLFDDARQAAWAADVEIEYEYGLKQVPRKIKAVGIKRARGNLTGMNARIDERATVMSIPDFGTFNLATPGRGNSYVGIPEVDAVLDRWMLGTQKGGAH